LIEIQVLGVLWQLGNLLDHPSPNPRFHGLFIFLSASKESFINGYRPFIGKLVLPVFIFDYELVIILSSWA
jgi:hypothetical protein